MKPPRWTVLGSLVVGAALSVFGEATFLTQNIAIGLDAPVYDWTGGLLVGADWRAELYAGLTADSLSPVLGYHTRDRVFAPFFAPGYFQGADYVYVPSSPELGWAWLQVMNSMGSRLNS
jgi:hypothetical protein